MSGPLVVFASVKGSPGVTTLMLAVAANWRGDEGCPPVVADLDPAGGDVAAYLGMAPNLVDLAAAGRHHLSPGHVTEIASLWQPDIFRVLAAPISAREATTVLDQLPTLGGVLGEHPAVVLADVGRLSPATASVVEAADAVVIVVHGSVPACAHAALAGVREQVALVLAEGPPSASFRYDANHMAAVLGREVLATIPWDPKGAQGPTAPRRSRFQRAASELATAIRSRTSMPVDV